MSEQRLLMSFRADEVAPGDFLALPFGPAEVVACERMIGDKGVVIEITARVTKAVLVGEVTSAPKEHTHATEEDAGRNLGDVREGGYVESEREVTELLTFRPAPHEFVCLWESR